MIAKIAEPFRFAAGLAAVLFFAFYLGFCDWRDKRRAKRAGAEWEGEVI